jgi:aryl-alcohol dehydrogenase-like predicted oxidoreductase
MPAEPSDPREHFTHKHVRAFGKRVHRLGLACNYGIGPADFEHGLERGLGYVYWTNLRTGKIAPSLRAALSRDRDKLVVATGPLLGFFGGGVRRGCEAALRSLGIDTIDVFQLAWLGVTSSFSRAVQDELIKLRGEGKVRAIGVSIHDRPRAGRLAADSPLDLLMIRYNAAHPGAERDIFPHLGAREPAIVAYTATARRKLLKAPSGWTGPTPTPGDCYRFCLSSPHVDVVLTGPKDRAQLDHAIDAIERGPLSADEMKTMRDFGRAAR